MAGGSFTPGVEKVRPGFYVNFESSGKTAISLSERGITIMPLLSRTYGPVNEFIHLYNDDMDAAYAKFGYKMIDPEMLLINEAFKRAKEVIVYIPAADGTGTKAKAVATPLTAEAKYIGNRGNDFKVIVEANPVAGMDVSIYLGVSRVFYQEQVVNVEDLKTNDFVNFTGTGALVANAGVSFTGGTAYTTTNGDITDFLQEAETQAWNTMAFPVTDAALISAFDSKIKYFNNDIGKYCQGVRPKAGVNADCEYIITLNNGVVLSTGTVLTAAQACAWYAGASAGASITTDLTYEAYDGANDANPRLNNADTKTALKSGEVVFSVSGSEVIVEEDINSLTTFTTTRDEAYTDNRVIRTLQEIAITGAKTCPPNKYDNDDDGQKLAKQDLTSILTLMEEIHALKNVDVDHDVDIDAAKSTGKSLYATLAVQPVRTYKKYYITVKTS